MPGGLSQYGTNLFELFPQSLSAQHSVGLDFRVDAPGQVLDCLTAV